MNQSFSKYPPQYQLSIKCFSLVKRQTKKEAFKLSPYIKLFKIFFFINILIFPFRYSLVEQHPGAFKLD